MTISPVASRVVAAIVLGYAFANTTGIALTCLLPLSRSDAVMTSILLSFLLYAGAITWVFSARTAQQAWRGLLIPTLVSCVIVAVVKMAGIDS